jgi:hypothetical protein
MAGAWRERLGAAREAMLEDDEEDEINLAWIMGLGEDSEGEVEQPKVRGRSHLGKAQNIWKRRAKMHNVLIRDYFSKSPVYSPIFYLRQYRMKCSLFCSIMERVCVRDNYLVQKLDACGLPGFSSHQKIIAALRILCYGMCTDATNEYCRTNERTAMESLKRFCMAVRLEFEAYYLRQPTRVDFDRQLAINSARGFPRMFANLKCMHYE